MSNLINGRSPEYWEGVKSGMKHQTPSPETKRWMDDIERDIKEMKCDLTDLRERNIINSLASKGFLAMIGLAVTAVFVALVNLVIR